MQNPKVTSPPSQPNVPKADYLAHFDSVYPTMLGYVLFGNIPTYHSPRSPQVVLVWRKLVAASKRRNIKAVVLDTPDNANPDILGLYEHTYTKKIKISRKNGDRKVITFLHEFIHHIDISECINVYNYFPNDTRPLEIVAYCSTYLVGSYYFGDWVLPTLEPLRRVFRIGIDDIKAHEWRIKTVSNKVLAILEGSPTAI